MIEWTRTPVTVDGHRVMTYTAGTGPRTVLIVHGGPGCPSRYLRDSHQDLMGHGLRVVTWDQLGCGESDRPEDPGPQDPALWTIDRYVYEMETVRRALDLGLVDVLGQSWGGVLGLEYVLRHPDNVRSFIAYIVPELAAMARDRLPNGELAFFPGCSHMPFFEAPQRYLDTVAEFLQRC